MKKLKHLKTFEGLNNAENAGLYDEMTELLINASEIYKEFSGEDYEFDPKDAVESLKEIPIEHVLYPSAQNLIDSIQTVESQIDELDSEEYFEDEFEDEDVECPDCKGTGYDSQGEECERCGGEGRVPKPYDIPTD